ncbi:DUF6289 family protein [Luteimonas aquatica]|uniref:DUF6289 family protein n=1 Tax=Luteimonas aquatica TaxID=450364 RepID=UPI001F566EE0|nr:DUF6289 family protein [Luteimonas aquatica]
MQGIKMIVLGALLAVSAGTGAAARVDCCYPGTVVYYDDAGTVVGVRMYGCGDPGWGIVTLRSKAYNGCIM